MELFHEYKNKYFHLVFRILNLAYNGLEKQEILKIIAEEEYEEKVIDKEFKTFEGMMLNEYEYEKLNLLKKENNKYYTVLNNRDSLPIKVRFSKIEKVWLNGLLEDRRVQSILGKEMIDKLKKALIDICEGSNEVIEFTNKNKSDFEYDLKKLDKDFFTILEAIKEEKTVIYTNIDREGNEYKDKLALPLRIEYSLKDDKFRASMYSIEDKRPILVNLHTLKAINISGEKCKFTRKELIKEMKENKYCEEPITIILKDVRGAMERCFMSFSSFERSSRALGDNNYEIDIYYYCFQEYDVISKIISLGPYVTVKKPERIRELIIERIRKAYEYQKAKV